MLVASVTLDEAEVAGQKQNRPIRAHRTKTGCRSGPDCRWRQTTGRARVLARTIVELEKESRHPGGLSRGASAEICQVVHA